MYLVHAAAPPHRPRPDRPSRAAREVGREVRCVAQLHMHMRMHMHMHMCMFMHMHMYMHMCMCMCMYFTPRVGV